MLCFKPSHARNQASKLSQDEEQQYHLIQSCDGPRISDVDLYHGPQVAHKSKHEAKASGPTMRRLDPISSRTTPSVRREFYVTPMQPPLVFDPGLF